MRTRRWPLIIIGLTGGLLVFWGFWSLGSLPVQSSPILTLIPHAGEVSRRATGSSTWQKVTSSVTLAAGDEVRTGQDGAATIEWYGVGQSHVAGETDFVVTAPSEITTPSSPLRVDIALTSGRLWTRLLRLLDLNSQFGVHAGSVAATVRGTAFDVQQSATGTIVWVTDSDVSIEAAKNQIVNEGSMASFSSDGRVLESRALSSEELGTDWATTNASSDAAFLDRSSKQIQARLMGLGGQEPGSLMDRLSRLSEQLHLALDSTHAATNEAGYVTRRLFHVTQFYQEGKSGLAVQALTNIQDEIQTQLKASNGQAFRQALDLDLRQIVQLIDGANPNSPTYQLQQHVEDLQTLLDQNATDPGLTLYTRMLNIESSLITADTLLNTGLSQNVQELLDAAHQDELSVESDLTSASSSIQMPETNVLFGKLLALKARESGLRARLTAAFNAQSATSTEMLPPGATETTSTSTTSSPTSTSATSTMPVPPVVRAATTTASVPVVTPSSTTPVPAVPPPKRPVRLDVIPQGQTTLSAGGSLSFQAVRVYSDGSTLDVSSQVTCTVQNPQMGSCTGHVFTAVQNQDVHGEVQVIVRDPASQTSISGRLDVTLR